MKLHLDKDAFSLLLERIHEKTGYRTDVLEKDYYVVLILKELSHMQQDGLPAYFKGGTALYKALKTTNRFSEDIDLSVDSRDCSRTQNDKRLERATKKYTSLTRDIESGKTNRSEVISVYNYEPVTSYDVTDSLQRFGKLKIEATSFTISEPVEALNISPMIYDLATEEEKHTLEINYNVTSFDVLTITLERIFIDKLFAAEAYVRNSEKDSRAFEAAKHIYDLAVLETHPKIISLINDEKQMEKLLSIRLEEEQSRLDGIPSILPADFIFFTETKENSKVQKAYETMQNQYVMRNEDRIDFDSAMNSITRIHRGLMNNLSWHSCQIHFSSNEIDEFGMNQSM